MHIANFVALLPPYSGFVYPNLDRSQSRELYTDSPKPLPRLEL